jgi:hypothetical protein
MKYLFGNRTINIPDDEIRKAMDNLGLTCKEATEMWLEDNGYLENEEQNALDEKAKKVKISDHRGYSEKAQAKEKKPRTVVISDEKKALFQSILKNLDRCCEENFEVTKDNIEVITENKLIRVKIGDKTFDINIVEKRKPKA